MLQSIGGGKVPWKLAEIIFQLIKREVIKMKNFFCH
jgi:hypothetical protein